MRRFVVIVGLAFSAVACLGSDFADSLEGSWRLTSGTVDGEPIPILDSHPITIAKPPGPSLRARESQGS